MFGIGMSEMLIIMAVALLVFGPNKLPEIAKSIARGLRELQRAGDELRASVDLDAGDGRRPRANPARSHPVTSRELGVTADDSAQIPGSDLARAPDADRTSEPWPRAAEGTLAQGALDEIGSAAASSTGHSTGHSTDQSTGQSTGQIAGQSASGEEVSRHASSSDHTHGPTKVS